MAVIALISGYEIYMKYLHADNNIASNFKFYFFSNLYSTLIASLATAPLILYHFYIFSPYTIFANMLAVPLTSFIIMPAAIISLILMPFHLEKYSLKLMGQGINYVIQIADYTTNFKYAACYFGHIESIALLIYIFGFLWLCLWQSSWRFYAFIPIIISIILMLTTKKPQLIISPDNFAVAINKAGVLYVDKTANKFNTEYWTSWFGQEEIKRYDNKNENLFFKNLILVYNNPKCYDGYIIINLSKFPLSCRHNKVVNKKDFYQAGAHIFFEDGSYKNQK